MIDEAEATLPPMIAPAVTAPPVTVPERTVPAVTAPTGMVPPASAPFASGPTPPPPSPHSAGWSGAATAIHSIQQIPKPILISLQPAQLPPIAIDLRYHTYVWGVGLREFPAEPDSVAIGTYPLEGDSPKLAGPAKGLDPLLWLIGVNAFEGATASWLRSGDKFRLKRWPDMDIIPHAPLQGVLVKKLAKGMMTVEKLAGLAGSRVDEAQDVVNALSLMGALKRLESKNAAPALPPVTPDYEAPDRQRGRHVRRGG